MNRIQFWTLIGLSGLVVLLLIVQIILIRQDNAAKNGILVAQAGINQGQAFQSNLKQLAVRIFQDSQKTQDQGLKDLLARQQITYTPQNSDNTGGTQSVPNSAPSSISNPTH